MIATDLCVRFRASPNAWRTPRRTCARNDARGSVSVMSATRVPSGTSLVDPDSEADVQEAWDLNTRLMAGALAMGGTCTGERASVLASGNSWSRNSRGSRMRQLKATLDPDGLFNPGKVV